MTLERIGKMRLLIFATILLVISLNIETCSLMNQLEQTQGELVACKNELAINAQ
jgi:hypothetical protein